MKKTGCTDGQKILNGKVLIVFIILLSAFIPLSFDIYLPALPAMTEYFAVSESVMNLSLSLFFAVYAFASLVWGPLSDKHGRKPVLLIGIALYLIASVSCALSQTIVQLLLFRVLQAIGGGVTLTVSTAIVRDMYTGKKQETILALVQSMTMFCPVAAPILGAALLGFTDWRGIFYAQVVFGVIAILLSVCYTETNKNRSTMTILRTFAQLGVVMKNPRFAILFPVFHLVSIGLMAYVSSSAYIFQNFFGLDSKMYSYFFAITSVGMMTGPLLYVWLVRYFPRNGIIKVCLAVVAVSGVMSIFFGMRSPWILVAVVLPMGLAGACIRPAGTFLILAQQKSDIGTASSLMTFSGVLLGSIGMSLATALPFNMIVTVGMLNLITAIVSGTIWLGIEKKYTEIN